MTVRGVDVSSVQGYPGRGTPPVWAQVAAAGYGFGIAKALEGNADYPDPSFAWNWPRIAEAGMVRGAYAFLHPDSIHARDAEDEAKRFVARVGALERHDFLMGDIEDASTVAHGVPDGEPFLRWLVTWVETVRAESGKRSMLYMGGPYFVQHAGKLPSAELITRLLECPLVIAAYVDDPYRYVAMTPWRERGWTIWQRSGDVGAHGVPGARVPGIACTVDEDVFPGTLDELQRLVASLADPPTREPGLQLGDDGPAHDPYSVDRGEAALADTDRAPPPSTERP